MAKIGDNSGADYSYSSARYSNYYYEESRRIDPRISKEIVEPYRQDIEGLQRYIEELHVKIKKQNEQIVELQNKLNAFTEQSFADSKDNKLSKSGKHVSEGNKKPNFFEPVPHQLVPKAYEKLGYQTKSTLKMK